MSNLKNFVTFFLDTKMLNNNMINNNNTESAMINLFMNNKFNNIAQIQYTIANIIFFSYKYDIITNGITAQKKLAK
jgi:hypothetical protein